MLNKLTFCLSIFLFSCISNAQEKEICAYTAKISKADKLNVHGTSIDSTSNKKTAFAFLRMDRANYYRYGKRDPEDESDCYFLNLKNRERIADIVEKSSVSEDLLQKIAKEEPTLNIKIFKNKLEISEYKKNNNSEISTNLKSTNASNDQMALAQSPVSKEKNQQVPPVQQNKKKVSLLDGAMTEQELVLLQRNVVLQEIYKKWIKRPDLAICTAMIAEIEHKVSQASFELSPSQWKIYSGVAAAMIFIKEYLLKTDVTERDLAADLDEVFGKDGDRSNENIYAQCYKVIELAP